MILGIVMHKVELHSIFDILHAMLRPCAVIIAPVPVYLGKVVGNSFWQRPLADGVVDCISKVLKICKMCPAMLIGDSIAYLHSECPLS